MPRRSLRIATAALVFTGGVLFTASIDNDATPTTAATPRSDPLAPVSFSVSLTRGLLRLQGATESAEHETALLQLAADQFKNVTTRGDFEAAVLLPPDWTTTSSRLLYVLAATESAEAIMQEHSIAIRAVTTDARTFSSRLAFLHEALPTDVELTTEILDVAVAASFDELCERSFAELELGPVSFRESSTELRDSSFAPLHRLVDFANDCTTAVIVIIGHTDATGDESWNRRLSLARAQAVADHLVEHGVDGGRLVVTGQGSAQPIADNATIHGRERNRRIEFELR